MSQSETLMLLILGFSSAAFLGLIAGRIAWKLAFRLGARHTQRNMPSTMIELQTDRDRMRAEHAMMAKKLELRLGDIRMRMAEQTAEVSRHRNRFEILKQDVAKRDEMLVKRNAEIATLRDKVSYLEVKLEEKESELEALNESLVEVEEVDEVRETPAVAAPVPTQDRLKNRIKDIVKISKQISKQKKGAPLELEQPVPMTETEVIVKPADSSTLEFVAQSEVLEEKIVETERAAEELQDELKRLDQAWSGSETVPEAAPEPVADEAIAETPAPAEEEKPKSAITNVISLAQRIRSLHKDATK
jgi:DNA repair exonuclease SbcCD ATPase subunit